MNMGRSQQAALPQGYVPRYLMAKEATRLYLKMLVTVCVDDKRVLFVINYIYCVLI